MVILDNLENAAKAETQDASYKQGVEMVLKQFKDVLLTRGVEEIKAVGETFDPSLHEAVSSVDDPNAQSQTIVQEYRKGYKIGSKVIMRKPHPCGTNLWEITRVGVDIKIKCVKCGRGIMMDRMEFDKKIKKVEEF